MGTAVATVGGTVAQSPVGQGFGQTAWAARTGDGILQALEWYTSYDSVRPLIQKHLTYSDSLLLLGPGTSDLHEQLYDSGYRGITVVDFCPEVLRHWRKRAEVHNRGTLRFEQADVTQGLDFQPKAFHFAIDKGTLDCILCSEEGAEAQAAAAIRHVFDSLRSSGVFLLFSHSSPELRRPLLETSPWEDIKVKVVMPPDLHEVAQGSRKQQVLEYAPEARAVPELATFIYVMRKGY